MRLIDADELKRYIRECVRIANEDGTPYTEEDFETMYSVVCSWIDRQNIVEMRPKGEWMGCFCECSICGRKVYYDADMNFCPSCGADMRGNHDQTEPDS